MAYGHTFSDDVKPMWQNRSENFAIYRGTKVDSFQAFEFLFQQVVAESREELRSKYSDTVGVDEEFRCGDLGHVFPSVDARQILKGGDDGNIGR